MRLHVPFDTFGMREEVCVSNLVSVGNLGWTCGQCPLDQDGEVVAPRDLLYQTSIVCEMIESVVARGHFDPTMIGKLNVYFAENAPDDGPAALALIRERFPHAIVLPVPVPDFYYAGMMIEVDVFAATGSRPRHQLSETAILNIVEIDNLTWVHVQARPGPGETLADAMHGIETALHAEDLHVDNLLSDQWFVSRTLAGTTNISQTMAGAAFLSMADSVVVVDNGDQRLLSADLTFSKRKTVANHAVGHDDALQIATRSDGHLYSMKGVQPASGGDLVSQTGAIMAGIAAELTAHGLSFSDVVKVTAHYVGDASAEDLHRNLAIRHRYYEKPGPASTGLRVASLLHPDCLIAIAITAIR